MSFNRDLHTGYWANKSVFTYFVALAGLILIPGLLIAGWYAYSWAVSEQSGIEQDARHRAREIMTTIDHEVAGLQDVLIALATSPLLQAEDLAAFYRQAVEVARKLNIQINLRDVPGNVQIINTARPWGVPLARAAPPVIGEAIQTLLQSGKPAVSGAFLAALIKRHVVVVMVPVTRNGTIDRILTVVLPVERFADSLSRYRRDSDCVTSVVDQNGVIIARSKRQDDFVGKLVASDRSANPPSEDRTTNEIVEGTPCRSFSQFSKITRWSFTVSVPDSVLAAPFKLALATFSVAGILIVIFPAIIAYGFAGRISSRMGALQSSAIVERKLREEQFQAITDTASNGIVAVDGDGRILLLNAPMAAMFGYARDDLIGHPIGALLSQGIRTGHVENRVPFVFVPDAMQNGTASELFGRRKDGSEFPVEINLCHIKTIDGEHVMATVRDITARRHAAEYLTATLAERDGLRRQLMQAQEQERSRLARDLHDETGQVVVATLMELKELEVLVDEKARDRIHNLRWQLEQMAQGLDRIARELRPASIDQLGLASTLADYAAEWSMQFGVPADFHCGNGKLDNLSDEVSISIYRIVQEALTNIAKHAREVTAVGIILDLVGAELRLTIEDNGCGFDKAKMPEHQGRIRGSGLGLEGMRERLSLIGGELEIESTGAGTTLRVRVPLVKENARHTA